MPDQELKQGKAVLISIQPRWCELIASGKKTVEVRKTVPKLEPPFKCYIYCTKGKRIWTGNVEDFGTLSTIGNGNVIGEFVCNKIENIEIRHFTVFGHENRYAAVGENPDHQWLRKSCLSYDEVVHYGKMAPLYGWHISDLVIYDEPKPLSEFYKCGAVPLEDLDEELCAHCAATNCGDTKSCYTPNGLQMCEGRWCAEAYQSYLDEEFALTRAPQSWCYVQEV